MSQSGYYSPELIRAYLDYINVLRCPLCYHGIRRTVGYKIRLIQEHPMRYLVIVRMACDNCAQETTIENVAAKAAE